MNPFDIHGPAVISFSGGRTSGYMLRQVLDAGLRPDVHVIFADTGKERPETYDFVRACAEHWQVAIQWVFRPGHFEQLIKDRGYLPNVMTRFCTQELKIRPMKLWMRARGYDHWTNVVGIRHDEPRRVTRMLANDLSGGLWDIVLPLDTAGVTEPDVLAFWRAQPFDLQLEPHEGNCDLCFLKGQNKVLTILRTRPDLATWWIAREVETGNTFRKPDRPTYQMLLDRATTEPQFNFDADADAWDEAASVECFCHD
jgi:hypothetical protein